MASKAWGIRKLRIELEAGDEAKRENLACKAELFMASSVMEQNSSVPRPSPLDFTLNATFSVHTGRLRCLKALLQVSAAHCLCSARGMAEVPRESPLWKQPSARLIGLAQIPSSLPHRQDDLESVL